MHLINNINSTHPSVWGTHTCFGVVWDLPWMPRLQGVSVVHRWAINYPVCVQRVCVCICVGVKLHMGEERAYVCVPLTLCAQG